MREKYVLLLGEIIAFLCIFFMDIQEAMFAIGFLIFTDTFTGIWAAWYDGRNKEGSWWKGRKYIESRKMERIITKLILYPLSLITAKVAEQYLTPIIPWIDITAGILAMIEIRSIFENIGKILGYDLWNKMKEKIVKRVD
jgi:hypothetical protein